MSVPVNMSSRTQTKRTWKGVVLYMVIAMAVLYGVKYGRKYVFLDNFGVVEQGSIYRSGQLKPFQFEKVIKTYGIKTIINTREPEAPARIIEKEQAVCDKYGVNMVRIAMPGDGRGTVEQLDEAVAILSDEVQLPALVHCARGTHRTGAIIAAYRASVQGRTFEEILNEMETYRFKPEDHVLVPYLEDYLQSRGAKL